MLKLLWQKFKNLGIGTKAFVFSLLTFLIIITLISYNQKNLSRINEKSKELDKHVELLFAIGEVDNSLDNYAFASCTYRDHPNANNLSKFLQKKTDATHSIDHLENLINGDSHFSILKINNQDVFKSLNQEKNILNTYYQNLKTAKSIEEMTKVHEQIDVQVTELKSGHHDLLSEIATEKNAVSQSITDLINNAVRQSIYFGFVVMIAMLLVVLLIQLTIIKPIVNLERIVKLTDFSKRIKASDSGHDEIGSLGKSFNQTMQNLKKAYSNLNTTTLKLSSILENISDGVIVMDNNFKIIMFNPMAAKITGFSEEEASGQGLDKILNFKDKGHYEVMAKNLAEHGYCSPGTYCNIQQKKGRNLIIQGRAQAFDVEGERQGSVLVFRDATRENEVSEMKSQFVSMTSHQLNAPITSINWALDIVLSEDLGKLTHDQKKTLLTAYNSGLEMKDLVKALLDISHIETGKIKLNFKNIKINDVILSLTKEMQPILKTKNQIIQFASNKENLVVYADEVYLRQVVQNLISNASKYSGEGSEIKIQLTKKDEIVTLSVEDSGIGIPKADQKKLFSKFYRASNVSGWDGNGLGLYIIKEITKIFKGKIWFESIEGKGSIFYISLPTKVANKKDIPQNSREAATC